MNRVEVLAEANHIIGHERSDSTPIGLVARLLVTDMLERVVVSGTRLEIRQSSSAYLFERIYHDSVLVRQILVGTVLEDYGVLGRQFAPAYGSRCRSDIRSALAGNRYAEVTLDYLYIIYKEVAGSRRLRCDNSDSSLACILGQWQCVFLPITIA